MKSVANRFTIIAIMIVATAICCHGQLKVKSLPTIAFLRSDEPAGYSRGGCDNHEIVLSRDSEKLIFISAGEGYKAVMNLNGHNVELKQLRTTLDYIDAPYDARAVYEYGYKGVRITVRLTAQSDYTTYVPATITVRSGRARRIIRGFVAPQCDAI